MTEKSEKNAQRYAPVTYLLTAPLYHDTLPNSCSVRTRERVPRHRARVFAQARAFA